MLSFILKVVVNFKYNSAHEFLKNSEYLLTITFDCYLKHDMRYIVYSKYVFLGLGSLIKADFIT